eukprot:TRINITY_DN4717_c0_g1_i1.p1 TRINITY_DN4717_c0_g1~~TRINITY_DN4717_c0_g1_i1.p1  ORF type:complete len:574 (+),score=136.29 TRINITY_DN4717_c0_g1_i1:54-1775(+)
MNNFNLSSSFVEDASDVTDINVDMSEFTLYQFFLKNIERGDGNFPCCGERLLKNDGTFDCYLWYSHIQISRMVNQLYSYFIDMKIKPGDVILVCGFPSPYWYVVYLCICKIGAQCLSINEDYKIKEILQEYKPKLSFVSSDFAGLSTNQDNFGKIVGLDRDLNDQYRLLEEYHIEIFLSEILLKYSPISNDDYVYQIDEPFLLYYSTHDMKILEFSHRSFATTHIKLADRLFEDKGDNVVEESLHIEDLRLLNILFVHLATSRGYKITFGQNTETLLTNVKAAKPTFMYLSISQMFLLKNSFYNQLTTSFFPRLVHSWINFIYPKYYLEKTGLNTIRFVVSNQYLLNTDMHSFFTDILNIPIIYIYGNESTLYCIGSQSLIPTFDPNFTFFEDIVYRLNDLRYLGYSIKDEQPTGELVIQNDKTKSLWTSTDDVVQIEKKKKNFKILTNISGIVMTMDGVYINAEKLELNYLHELNSFIDNIYIVCDCLYLGALVWINSESIETEETVLQKLSEVWLKMRLKNSEKIQRISLLTHNHEKHDNRTTFQNSPKKRRNVIEKAFSEEISSLKQQLF